MKKTALANLDAFNKETFRQDLIGWFEQEQRTLPWRQDQDPYKVWVSEIMLQQTRVDTVIPYFNRFIEQFPTIEALAEAEEDKVLKAWEGLGYYSRARNLQAAVREVHEHYGGRVPDNPKEISSLKGVGPYTAGAILSIAYGIPEPAVDGNVMRVLSRILSIWEDIAKPATRKIFEEAVRELISHENPSFFNQALMELGALICTPTSPSCLLCPVREHCHAFYEGKQSELPIKTKNKKQKDVQIAAVVLRDREGRYLIRKRPEKGLLANLWEFPNTEISLAFLHEKDQLAELIKEQYGAIIETAEMTGQIDHVFTHLTWHIHVYKGTLLSLEEERSDLKLVTEEELKEFAFPVSHQKMLKQVQEHK
ncbi:A/G-specific adenine glycosylase [Bacillus infantis]|uniref:A/G-specific adenine glycosylase n=1 Tax=Bacillus infantis TaxID=324767 RepID=UPI000B9B09A3|nr:A/G-specific adenine glycosylase [Bacillus infantis]MCK6207265.1 A/G-specific adenine glycosylase [Bacillus infantis]OXT16094.1 A/G-specific adenine glycosylase [Bacillus sp. OG2]